MTSFKLKTLAFAVALTSALITSGANAAPVTQWDYETNAVFSDPSWSSGDTGERNLAASEIKWGGTTSFQTPTLSGSGTWFSQNQSALTVGNFANEPETLTDGGPATGAVDTIVSGTGITDPAQIGRGVSLTHWNNPISSNWSTLSGAVITDTLRLKPAGAPSSAFENGPELTFTFKFLETPNAGTNGLCEDSQSATTVHGYNTTTQVGGCPDIFAYQTLDIVDQIFNYDGMNYFVSVLTLNEDGSVNTVGIPQLLDSQCSAVGLVSGCSGFVTAENTQTTVRFGFAISAIPLQEVPEPGTLALLGLGLLGVVLIRRRQA